ncbi:MAG: 50S ribosomal protein L5 [Candidatus Paceibacterota bacterium]
MKIIENNLREIYKKEVVPKLKEEFSLKNIYQVPKIEKVVINSGIGKLMTSVKNNPEVLKKAQEIIALISGQMPTVVKARKSIAGFKLREGMPVGLKVTLRGKKMEDFIFRFINLTLPRIRDFWGIPLKNIDQGGNLNYGLRDISVFPEMSKETLSFPLGVEITFVTNKRNREQAIRLFQLLGFPLQKEN